MEYLMNPFPAIRFPNIDKIPGKYGKWLSSQVVKDNSKAVSKFVSSRNGFSNLPLR